MLRRDHALIVEKYTCCVQMAIFVVVNCRRLVSEIGHWLAPEARREVDAPMIGSVRIHSLAKGLLLEQGDRSCRMPLITIVLVLIVVGVILWLINTYIPMQSAIKTILNVVVVIAVAVWVLQATGLWGTVSSYRISR